MTTQLVLVEEPHDWRLDARTREVGRRGVRLARQALGGAAVDPPSDPAPPTDTATPARARGRAA